MSVDRPHHYSIDLQLVPLTRQLAATVELEYYAGGADRLEFLLHRDLIMQSIDGELVQDYVRLEHCDYPFTTEAVTWRVQLSQAVPAGRPVKLRLVYAGCFQPVLCAWEVNQLTEDWVELGMYAPWYPWNPTGGVFTYQVHLAIPKSYQVSGLGRAIGGEDGWTLLSDQPGSDIVIAAAPDLQHVSRAVAQAGLEVYFTASERLASVEAMADDGLWILEFFRNWWQDGVSDRSISIIVAPRVKGGGYARPGMIMLSHLSESSNDQSHRLFRWIAHEMAHLWWCKAPVESWEDWLNEAFAEFSSMKAVEARFGTSLVIALIAQTRDKVKGLPPVQGISRTNGLAHNVLYSKGMLLLWDLEQMIGSQAMAELMRRRLTDSVNNTADFLQLLGRVAGSQAVSSFADWLAK